MGETNMNGMPYTQAEIAKIKASLPRGITLRISRKGLPTFLVRVSTVTGDRYTIGTFGKLSEAKQALADYRARTIARQVQSAQSIIEESHHEAIPTMVRKYLDSLPPHEVTTDCEIIMTLDSGAYYTIPVSMVRQYIRECAQAPEAYGSDPDIDYSFSESVKQHPTTSTQTSEDYFSSDAGLPDEDKYGNLFGD